MSEEIKKVIDMIAEDIEYYENPPAHEPKELYETYRAKCDYAKDILSRIKKEFEESK